MRRRSVVRLSTAALGGLPDLGLEFGRAQPSVTSARNMKGPLFHMRLYHDETAYVLIGAVHPLELIEVQVGSYLGEDDILRLEDVYRRHAEA